MVGGTIFKNSTETVAQKALKTTSRCYRGRCYHHLRLILGGGEVRDVVQISTAPELWLVKSFLSPSEVAGLEEIYSQAHYGGAFQDMSKPGEARGSTLLWRPKMADRTSRVSFLEFFDDRIVALCNFFAQRGESFSTDHVEDGYFAVYNKTQSGPPEIFATHNDNSDRKLEANPRVFSAVAYLNTPGKNALTVFPLAEPLGLRGESDPTAPLAGVATAEREPPPGAMLNGVPASPEPYWRFTSKEHDHVGSKRETRDKDGAWRIHERAEKICSTDAWDHIRVEAGDVAFFRSAGPDLAIDVRALHASCPNTGIKKVLSKFVHASPLSAGERFAL